MFNFSSHVAHQVIVVDNDHSIVRYDHLTMSNGIKMPNAANLEEWVQIDRDMVAWGNRQADGGAPTSRFELKLQTGAFTITSTDGGVIAHGWCRGPTLTVFNRPANDTLPLL